MHPLRPHGDGTSATRVLGATVLPVLAFCFLLSNPLAAWAQNPPHLWSQSFGDAQLLQAPTTVVTDHSGNVVFIGTMWGSANFGGGTLTSGGFNDIFLAKFDANGNHLWSRVYGGNFGQSGRAVTVDGADNIIFAGSFTGSMSLGGGTLWSAGDEDLFLAKFDANGNHLWSQAFGTNQTDQIANGVATDGSGNVLVTGRFAGGLDLGGGQMVAVQNDIFLAKFDQNGVYQWSQSFGDAGYETAERVAVDGSDNVAITGHFDYVVDFGGGPLNVVGQSDLFVAKFDAGGSHLWSRQRGDSGAQRGADVDFDGSGNVVVVGEFSDNVYVTKFDANGSELWSYSYSQPTTIQKCHGGAVDGAGNIYFTGEFWGQVDLGGGVLTSLGNYDTFLAKFDPDGNHIWSMPFGTLSSAYGRDVAVDAGGNVVVTGEFGDSIDFGGGPLTSAGGADIFLARFGSSSAVNLLGAQPDGDCLSTINTCETVSIVFERDDVSPARGVSLTFELSAELELCADVATSIVQGDWLAGYNSAFEIIDHGDGSFTVDQAILGLPCGVTTGGTLFTIDVAAAGSDGTGTITVTSVTVRDCDNAALPGDPGPAASISIDTVPPVMVTDLTASQDKGGNAEHPGTTAIDVAFAVPGDADVVEVYRAGYGDYPEYDDLTGAEPAVPSYPPPAPWTLTGLGGPGADYEAATPRDFWFYVVFTKDACGNVSPVSNRTGGTLNYHLGDVTPMGWTPPDYLPAGDNTVGVLDISRLGASYGLILTSPDPGSHADLDVGPTTDFSTDARPLTDDAINFEDLMLFAVNFGEVSASGPPARLAEHDGSLPHLELSVERAADGLLVRLLLLDNPGSVKGIHAVIDARDGELVPGSIDQGELLAAQGNPVFFAQLDEGAAGIDAAVLGRDATIHGSGEVARLRFRARGNIELAVAELRDLGNRVIGAATLTARRSDTPATEAVGSRLEFLAARPNPFNPSTVIRFRLAEMAPVSLLIYDVSGRKVRTLVEGELDAGEHTAFWDGRADRGQWMGSGVYMLRLSSRHEERTLKLQLVR